MPHHPNTKVCTHVQVTGHRCGSPALRNEQFCYFHQRMMRGVATPPEARLHPVALIENEEAIQASLMEVINAIARNTIDTRRAELILRALHIAVKNVRRTSFDSATSAMVREVPDYPAPAPPEMDACSEPGASAQPALPSAPTAQTWEAALKEAGERYAAIYLSRHQSEAEIREEFARRESIVNPTQRKPPASAELPATEITVRKKG
jgi:hypothetical protein